jgi:hypothetical protein
MKNKNILYLIAFCFYATISQIHGQTEDSLGTVDCGTKAIPDSLAEKLPWYGKPYYLDSLLEAEGYSDYPSSPVGLAKVVTKPYEIPSSCFTINEFSK